MNGLRVVRLADLGWSLRPITYRTPSGRSAGRGSVVETIAGRIPFLGPMGAGEAVRNGQRQMTANDTRRA